MNLHPDGYSWNLLAREWVTLSCPKIRLRYISSLLVPFSTVWDLFSYCFSLNCIHWRWNVPCSCCMFPDQVDRFVRNSIHRGSLTQRNPVTKPKTGALSAVWSPSAAGEEFASRIRLIQISSWIQAAHYVLSCWDRVDTKERIPLSIWSRTELWLICIPGLSGQRS